MAISYVSLFGFNFLSAADIAIVADKIIIDINNDTTGPNDFLITPNAYQVVHFSERKNAYLKTFYQAARYTLPDGMPIVWLSNLIAKQPIEKRLTGSDLFPVLWARIKKENLPVTFVLPSEHLGLKFVQEYGHCNYIIPDYFSADDDVYINKLVTEIAKSIVVNQSSFVFLGLGFPKQEILGLRLDKELKEGRYNKQALFLLIGASFEFYFGLKKRAPRVFQQTGLEWLYRLLSEPGRLWKRYTIDNVRFLFIVLKELLKGNNKRP